MAGFFVKNQMILDYYLTIHTHFTVDISSINPLNATITCKRYSELTRFY